MSTTTNEDQPDLRHYAAALRRLWFVPLVIGLLGAIVFSVASSSSSTLVTGRVALVDESSIAAALGLPKELGTKYSSAQAVLGLARSDDFRQAVAKTLGYDAIVTTSADETPGIVSISATGDGDRAIAVVNANLDELVKRRRELRARTVDAALAANQARLDTIEKRLTDIDKALAAVADPSSSLASGLLTEREKLLNDRTEVDNLSAGLNQLAGLSDGGITRVPPSRDEVTSTKAKRPVYGFVIGVLGGLAAVLALAFFDRRLRTRRDVERIAGAGALLGVLSRGGGDDALAVAAALAAVDRDGPGRVQLVPAGRGVDAAAVAADLRTAADGRVTLPALDIAGSAATAAAAGAGAGAAVVLVKAGAAREPELAIALDRLHNAGVPVAGVVLTALPTRLVASAVM